MDNYEDKDGKSLGLGFKDGQRKIDNHEEMVG